MTGQFRVESFWAVRSLIELFCGSFWFGSFWFESLAAGGSVVLSAVDRFLADRLLANLLLADGRSVLAGWVFQGAAAWIFADRNAVVDGIGVQ